MSDGSSTQERLTRLNIHIECLLLLMIGTFIGLCIT